MHWIFVDLDCTLIDTKDLVISGGPEPACGTPERAAWESHVTRPEILSQARAVPTVLDLIQRLRGTVNIGFRFLTNRRERLRTLTTAWLVDKHLPGNCLIMRPEDCALRAGEFKEQAIKDLLLTTHDTVLCIDDDPDGSMEYACRKNGWTLLKTRTY
jgi:hypothetical protein